MEAASTQRKNLVRSLDPRMKLLLVVVISTATMFTPSREVVAWNYIIIILLWLISGEVRHAIKFALIFAMVLVVEYASLWIPNDTLKMMVSFLLFIVARSLSMVIMCLWMSAGLCVDDLITSLQNMHIPKGFTITVAVVFRYIPTIGREFRNINNTMKMRGIAFNAKNLFFQPGRTMEYALVPLIMRSIKVADLSFFEMYATNMIDVVVNSYIFVLTIVLCMSFVNPIVSVIAVVGVLLSNLFLQLLGRKSQRNAPVHQKAQDDMISATLEYIRGMPIVKSFKQEGVAVESIAKAYRDSKEINIKIEKNFVPLNLLHLFSLKAAAVAMILLAANSVLCGTLEIPMMLMIVIFSFMMFSSTEAMNNAIHVLRTIDVIMDKLDAIKNTPPIDENGQDIKLSKFDIDFEDVSFGYNEKKVLEHVSLHIPENTTTAIVGPSGSGKTTICNLLARFYDVDNGCIKIGGVKISDMKCDSLLANITMVFQNVYLFRDSIANNIKFGKPDATKQEVIEAAKKACCYDFIMSLPDGFDTVIGDGGATLSGGEKQRISIARAMLKDAPIVILDEATASVDPENEHLIQQAISALTHGKTILIIAHRLATIENADQILVVDHGEIVQNGTHAELLKKPGIYQNFVSIRQQSEGWSIS